MSAFKTKLVTIASGVGSYQLPASIEDMVLVAPNGAITVLDAADGDAVTIPQNVPVAFRNCNNLAKQTIHFAGTNGHTIGIAMVLGPI